MTVAWVLRLMFASIRPVVDALAKTPFKSFDVSMPSCFLACSTELADDTIDALGLSTFWADLTAPNSDSTKIVR